VKNPKKKVAIGPVSAPEPRLLSVKAAAIYLGAAVWFVRTLAWNRAVPFVKFGSRILFDKTDLDNYIQQQKKPAA